MKDARNWTERKCLMKFFFHWKNVGFCACTPRTNKQQQTSKYCSDIAWTRKFGFLKQNLIIKDKKIKNIWREMLSSSMRRLVLCMKPLSCWRRVYVYIYIYIYKKWQINSKFGLAYLLLFSFVPHNLCGTHQIKLPNAMSAAQVVRYETN